MDTGEISREEGELSDDGEILDSTEDDKDEMLILPLQTSQRYLKHRVPENINPYMRSEDKRSRQSGFNRNRHTERPYEYARKTERFEFRQSQNNVGLPHRRNYYRSLPKSRNRPLPSQAHRQSNKSEGHQYRKNEKDSIREKSASAKSAELGVPDDYNELLEQYKTVQKQLDVLKMEEEKTSEILVGTNQNTEETATTSQEVKEEDEELDELKLRLLALASAAKAQIKASADELVVNKRNKTPIPKRRNSSKRKWPDTEQRKRREAQQILLLDDPDEQYARFMKMVGHPASNNKMSKKQNLPTQEDNYDPVEMEIDSSPESPESIMALPDVQQVQVFLETIPPPPPPPLPTATPPSSPPLPLREPDEEEEMLLREELLKSIKPKPKTKVKEANVTVEKLAPPPKHKPPVKIPRHKPVVISLGDDSSDNEGETSPAISSLLGGLDNFLKNARKAAESKTASAQKPPAIAKSQSKRDIVKREVHQSSSSKENIKKLQDLKQTNQISQAEKELSKTRSELQKNNYHLKYLTSQLIRRKQMLKVTQDKAQTLREQLAAAEKVMEANKQHIDRLEKQVAGAKKLVDMNVANVQKLEKSSDVKKDSGAVNEHVSKVKLKTDTQSKLAMIAHEKKRLQKLEREYAEKIQKLKEAQIKKQRRKSVSQQAHEQIRKKRLSGNTVQPDTSTDKISLSLEIVTQTTSEDTNVAITTPSFIHSASRNDVNDVNCKKKFEMPSNKQISCNIERLLLERTELPVVKTQLQNCQLLRCTNEDFFVTSPCRILSRWTKFQPYISCLLHLKSYRFSPYFHKRFKLSSSTFGNKINMKQVICHYELIGGCNDDDCPWQHISDTRMSQLELLQDLLSYKQSLSSDSGTQNKIVSYASSYYEQNKSSKTLEEMCLDIMKMVESSPPYFTVHHPRAWKPNPVVKNEVLHHKDYEPSLPEFGRNPDDEHLCDDDRYYLAINADQSVISRLSVLAKRLEENRDNLSLWFQYLKLYSQKKDVKVSDVLVMYKQAVQFAPNYELYFMYLSAAVTVSDKLRICREAITHLSSQCKMSEPSRSHQLLELILYRTKLSLQIGKLKSATKDLRNTLTGSTNKAISQCDCCIAWLCYISLMLCQQLPENIHSHDELGRILNKENVELQWSLVKDLEANSEAYSVLFIDALEECAKLGSSSKQNVQNCLPLYINYIEFENAVRFRREMAIEICEKALKEAPGEEQIWGVLMQLHEQSDFPERSRILSLGMQSMFNCAQLCHVAAVAERKYGNNDGSIHILESFIISMFVTDSIDTALCDPNLLFRKVLGLQVPLNYVAPPLKHDVTEQNVYLWLNYCMLLDLQGIQMEEVQEAYECGLCNLSKHTDIKTLWLSYLEYKYGAILQSSNQSVKPLLDLIKRCLVSVPIKYAYASNLDIWTTNYSFHNEVLSLLTARIEEKLHLTVYRYFIQLLPQNIPLVIRGCACAMKVKDVQTAMFLCNTAVFDRPKYETFWKRLISLQMQDGKFSEVGKSFMRATRILPYAASLWKNWLLFELSHGSQESLDQVVSLYTSYGLNLDDFLAAVLNK